jgi:hypothetical protein
VECVRQFFAAPSLAKTALKGAGVGVY